MAASPPQGSAFIQGIGIAGEIGASALRFGWYYGVNSLVERQVSRLGSTRRYKPSRPVPTRQELLADLWQLMLADAAGASAGTLPASETDFLALPDLLGRIRQMFADLPASVARRESENAASVKSEPDAEGLPDYFTQDFHFQTGGYLSEESARLYDVQVETLFYGVANLMRRATLPPIMEAAAGRDQRRIRLLDVACGTGRLLRQVRLAYPAMQLAGVDLSRTYLDEAARHLQPLRPARLMAANAEALPFDDASQDIVTCVFLFHELPPAVRRKIAAEMARVLKPGGTLVLLDSLQMGDKPGWDGLLEAFPVRFHEPYFRHYAIDDLDGLLSEAGLARVATSTAFLSKVMTRRRTLS